MSVQQFLFYHRRLALFASTKRARSSFSTATYYDSQSGLHVPLHNEQEISLILNKRNEDTSTSSFVPAHLYKEDPSSDMPQVLKELKEKGVTGIILPPVKFPRDIRNLVTLSAIAPKDFIFFSSGTKTIANSTSSGVITPSNVSMIVDFPSNHDNKVDDLESIMKEHVLEGTSTTISLQHIINNNEISPIALANKIATLLDNAGGGRGGGDYIWTANTKDADDDMIQICEELMYLDVAGKTIKSRLMVDAANEEVVEETMFAGVNKFVIDNDRQIDAIEKIVIDQGKTILR